MFSLNFGKVIVSFTYFYTDGVLPKDGAVFCGFTPKLNDIKFSIKCGIARTELNIFTIRIYIISYVHFYCYINISI